MGSLTSISSQSGHPTNRQIYFVHDAYNSFFKRIVSIFGQKKSTTGSSVQTMNQVNTVIRISTLVLSKPKQKSPVGWTSIPAGLFTNNQIILKYNWQGGGGVDGTNLGIIIRIHSPNITQEEDLIGRDVEKFDLVYFDIWDRENRETLLIGHLDVFQVVMINPR